MIHFRSFPVFLAVGISLLLFTRHGLAQQRAALISQQQSVETPYRYSGRLDVTHGSARYFGTATFIRRYTALTAGHLLYDGATGFSANIFYEPGLYQQSSNPTNSAAAISVLSGYQTAANLDGDSDASFARDLGYVIFAKPTPGDDYADWVAGSNALTQSFEDKLVLGYAAETLPGNALAYILLQHVAFYPLPEDSLYESVDMFYTQSGMSGGPVYGNILGRWLVVGEVVAGTSPPQRAFSDVRPLMPTERAFLIDPEYTQGLISGGLIRGKQAVPAGSTVTYKVGLTFRDGTIMGKGGLTVRYDELKLIVAGPNKRVATVKRADTAKYQVDFGSLPSGTQVELRLVRDTVKNKDQLPLQTYMVTVQ